MTSILLMGQLVAILVEDQQGMCEEVAAGGAALATGKVQQEVFRGFLRLRLGSEAALRPAGVGYF